MFSGKGVMEDIPLDLIIIPVPRHCLQTDEGGTEGRELLSLCDGVNALLRDWRRTDDEISFVSVERDNMLCCVCFSDNEYNGTATDWIVGCKDYIWLVNPRLLPVVVLIPPQPSRDTSYTYRVSSFHDVRRPGVRSVSVEQGVLGDPVIRVEGPLGGDGHQSILPAQVNLQPWLSVPGGWGPATAA